MGKEFAVVRNVRLVATIVAFLFTSPAIATVNHGDFLGTDVDFKAVSETTTTAGDPEPIWEAPVLSGGGNQLLFTPTSFISSCAGGGNDTTASDLTTNIEAHGGVHIDMIALQEAGDVVLFQSPPFGTAATNASAGLTGTVTVTEDINGTVTPAVVIPFSGTFTPSSSFALPTNFGSNSWKGDMVVDVASAWPNATKVTLSLTNTLGTNCATGVSSATMQKKSVAGPVVALMVNPTPCELNLDKTCCVTQPVLPDFDACGDNDDLVSLTLKFTGAKGGNSSNDQGGHFRCLGRRGLDGPADVTILSNSSTVTATPSSGIGVGDEVVFTSSTGTLPDELKLKLLGYHQRHQYMKIDT